MKILITISTDKCSEIFQKLLLGDRREPVRIDPRDEPNTIKENDVVGALWRFIKGDYMNGQSPIPAGDMEKIEMLYNCRHKFKKYLTPKSKLLYRGSTLNLSKAKSLLKRLPTPTKLRGVSGKPSSDASLYSGMDLKGGVKFYVFDYKYTPKMKIQSWTTDGIVAGMFSLEDVGQAGDPVGNYVKKIDRRVDTLIHAPNQLKGIPVIYQASTDDSFFGSKEFGNKVGDAVIGMWQNEIYRLGRSIKVKMYVPCVMLDALKEKM